MPVSLTDAGIENADIIQMAEKCTKNGAVGGFLKLEKKDCIAIYESSR